MLLKMRTLAALTATCALFATGARAVTLLNTFMPGGTINAIGYDSSSDQIAVHRCTAKIPIMRLHFPAR